MRKLVSSAMIVLGVGAVGAAMPGPSMAQVLEVDDVVSSMATARTGPVVRGLLANGSLAYQRSAQLPPGLDFASLNLQVEFDEGTHFLTAEGMRSLRSVALALQDTRMSGTYFQVAGHVSGTNNQTTAFPLSARRAAVVVEHLRVFYGIDPSRLTSVGYGPTKPQNPAFPGNPADTRIEFINVTDL